MQGVDSGFFDRWEWLALWVKGDVDAHCFGSVVCIGCRRSVYWAVEGQCMAEEEHADGKNRRNGSEGGLSRFQAVALALEVGFSAKDDMDRCWANSGPLFLFGALSSWRMRSG